MNFQDAGQLASAGYFIALAIMLLALSLILYSNRKHPPRRKK